MYTKTCRLAALGHMYGDWVSNGDGTHTRVCKRDASHTETGDCTGGTATCTAKAVCEVCKAEYGEKNPDNEGHTIEVTFVGDTSTPETGDSSQRRFGLRCCLLPASG